MPEATTDWFATVPENGVGLLLTQLHESPPSAPVCAPAGTASSTQSTKFAKSVVMVVVTTLLVEPVLVEVVPVLGPELVEVPVPLVEVITGLVVLVRVERGWVNVPLPASSQVARPSYSVKAMPRIVLPSKPTALDGTYRGTHWPVGGSAPI